MKDTYKEHWVPDETTTSPDHTISNLHSYGEMQTLNSLFKQTPHAPPHYEALIELPSGIKHTCEVVTFALGGDEEIFCIGNDLKTKSKGRVVIGCPPGTKIYRIEQHKSYAHEKH